MNAARSSGISGRTRGKPRTSHQPLPYRSLRPGFDHAPSTRYPCACHHARIVFTTNLPAFLERLWRWQRFTHLHLLAWCSTFARQFGNMKLCVDHDRALKHASFPNEVPSSDTKQIHMRPCTLICFVSYSRVAVFLSAQTALAGGSLGVVVRQQRKFTGSASSLVVGTVTYLRARVFSRVC